MRPQAQVFSCILDNWVTACKLVDGGGAKNAGQVINDTTTKNL